MNLNLKKHFNITAVVTFLVVVILSFFVINMMRKEDPILAEAKNLAGKEISVSEFSDVKTGEDYSEQIKNGNVLLVYLISSCDACKKEVKLISERNKELNSETKIFGVMFEEKESVNDYIKKHNINFPVLIDKDGKLLRDLDLKYFPANFKLENGIIEKTTFGAPKNQDELSELIISKR